MAMNHRGAGRGGLDAAMSRGFTGIAGCLPTVSPAPVTAQVMMTLGFMGVLAPRSSNLPEFRQDWRADFVFCDIG